MAETTGISWCDHTQNFWIGCTAVSPACAHCYAEKLVEGRMGRVFSERRRTVPDNWRKPFVWDRKAREAGVRRRVFTLSLGDFWDNQADPEWRLEALDIIRQTPNLDWLILTKRPMNIRVMLVSAHTSARTVENWVLADWLNDWLLEVPPANVWLGTTVENQEEANRRIPYLMAVPARVRFLSCEPLLEAVDLTNIKPPGMHHGDAHGWSAIWKDNGLGRPCIDWVICGGESGSGARIMQPRWARMLRDQCAANDVPFFFKQWGEWAPAYPQPSETPGRYALSPREWDGVAGEIDHYPRQFTAFGSDILQRVGTKKAGNRLGGVQHQAWPDLDARRDPEARILEPMRPGEEL